MQAEEARGGAGAPAGAGRKPWGLGARARAAGVHAAGSGLLLALPLWLWARSLYPGFLFEWDGGWQALSIALPVDLVLGPLLTLLVWAPGKARKALALDLCVIGALQLGAAGFGASRMHEQRPAALVFSEKAFRVVAASQVEGALPAWMAGAGAAPAAYFRFPSTRLPELLAFLEKSSREGRAYNVDASRWAPMGSLDAKEREAMMANDLRESRIEEGPGKRAALAFLASLPPERRARTRLYALAPRYGQLVAAYDFGEGRIVAVFEARFGSLMAL